MGLDYLLSTCGCKCNSSKADTYVGRMTPFNHRWKCASFIRQQNPTIRKMIRVHVIAILYVGKYPSSLINLHKSDRAASFCLPDRRRSGWVGVHRGKSTKAQKFNLRYWFHFTNCLNQSILMYHVNKQIAQARKKSFCSSSTVKKKQTKCSSTERIYRSHNLLNIVWTERVAFGEWWYR